MANKIKIKRSAVAGKVPLTTDLELSELAVNTNDGRLYTKKNDGTESVVEIGGPDFGSRNVTTTGTVTGASLNPSSSTVPANGVYLPAANTIGISTNSTSRLRIDSSGRVGVGTTNPQSSLDVRGIIGAIGAASNNGIIIGDYGSGTAPSTGTFSITAASGKSLVFRDETGAVERARIDSSGRLLVGTSSARTIATQSLAIQNEGTSFGTTGFSTCRNSNDIYGSYIYFGKTRGASVGSNTIVASGDDLGGLVFAGGDGTDVDSQAAYILCQVDGTPGANDMPGRLVFSTTVDGASSPTERMRITSEGRVRIGGTSTVNNERFLVVADGTYVGGTFYQPITGSYTAIAFNNPNGVVGSIATTGVATAYNTSSDYRLKENVAPVADGIARLQQLKPSRFNFIADPGKTVDGFIAHEVQAIVPEAITGEKDAVDKESNPIYQGIDQSKLVPLLTAALQEAVAKIETLEAKVAALEAA